MKRSALRQSFNTGIVFGIVHVFCVLIGFNSLMGILLAKLVGVKTTGAIPVVGAMIAYAALLGFWAGSMATRKQKTAGSRLLASSITGLSLGLVGAVLVGVFLAFITFKVNLRNYIAILSVPFMKACLFNLANLNGVLVNFAVFFVSSLAGGLVSVVWNLSAVTNARKSVKSAWLRAWNFLRGGSNRAQTIKKYALFVLLFALIALLPLKWGSYWNYVLGTVGLYVILGLGLNIIVGLSGQLVLGYIAFFAIGAYTMAILNAPEPHHLMWGFWPALLLGILLAALSGLLIGLPIMRLRGDYLAIVTLGFGEIIRILLKSDVLTSFTGGPRGIQDIHGPTLFGKPFNDIDYMYLIVLAVVLAIYVYGRLQHSRAGRAWLAIREDETVARATGVDTGKYKLMALMIGAAFAGLAGGIYAARNQFTGPDEHSLMASINVLSLIIVGGMGNIPGTLLGAFTLKGIPEILREVENYRMLAFGAVLVAMMIFRPDGLIASQRPTLELPEEESDSPNSANAPGAPPVKNTSAEKTHD
jgi:ABC-type branched-subunit amino acid transport system permease subunit